MARRADLKKERQERSQERRKMMRSFLLSSFICGCIIFSVILFLIPKMILTLEDVLNTFFEEPERSLFMNSPFAYLMAFLQDIGITGYVTIFHFFVSMLLILFFIFFYVALGNIREYQRAVSGWFELIVNWVITIVFAALFFELSNLTVLVLTVTGCLLFSVL